jgi:DeoR-like helix-turn-helix domain
MNDKGQIHRSIKDTTAGNKPVNELLVLNSSIFSNVFKKDIKRVYIYKKAERLAKAIFLVSPAFSKSGVLLDRFQYLATSLVDSAILPPGEAKEALSKDLLALSSLLAIARASGTLSFMNADIISREVHTLLSEIATYEEPRFFLEDSFSLAELLHEAERQPRGDDAPQKKSIPSPLSMEKRKVSVRAQKSDELSKRQEEILSVIKDKGEVYIKDVSTLLREYSEKTIQRELSSLVLSGVLEKKGDKRWTTYRFVRP